MSDGRHVELVVVGASAGGVDALTRLVAKLPADFPAAVCVVLHVLASGTSMLPSILARAGLLPARHAVDGDPIEPGVILVAPPDSHLLVEGRRARVTRGPRENGHRPAIDPLFRTAARSFGPRVAGVVLSGSLDDGTVGLRTIKICGGAALVQDPDEALYPSMPRSAIAHVAPDRVLPVSALAEALVQLAEDRDISDTGRDEMFVDEPSPDRGGAYTCPDCGGALEETLESGLLRFRCKVGHAYSQESLLYLQAQQLETALWAALRALEDRAQLAGRVAERLRGRGGRDATADRYERQAGDASEHAGTLRLLLERVEAIEQPDPAAGAPAIES